MLRDVRQLTGEHAGHIELNKRYCSEAIQSYSLPDKILAIESSKCVHNCCDIYT